NSFGRCDSGWVVNGGPQALLIPAAAGTFFLKPPVTFSVCADVRGQSSERTIDADAFSNLQNQTHRKKENPFAATLGESWTNSRAPRKGLEWQINNSSARTSH